MAVAASALRARVLVVDDEQNALAAIVELLRDEGYEVEPAPDGFRALAKLATFAPDLVVTDLDMPGLDGMQLLRRLREQAPHVSVIVMTARAEPGVAEAAVCAGARACLAKPLDFFELVRVIACEMNQGPGAAPPRRAAG